MQKFAKNSTPQKNPVIWYDQRFKIYHHPPPFSPLQRTFFCGWDGTGCVCFLLRGCLLLRGGRICLLLAHQVPVSNERFQHRVLLHCKPTFIRLQELLQTFINVSQLQRFYNKICTLPIKENRAFLLHLPSQNVSYKLSLITFFNGW